MTADPIREIPALLALMQADAEHRFVMEDGPRVEEPAYGLYQLPAEGQGVHELIAPVAADSPAFAMLHHAAESYMSTVPTGDGLPPLHLEPIARIFTLDTAAIS
jgi:hypothetical protein